MNQYVQAHKDDWRLVEEPEFGDGVLIYSANREIHIGVYLGDHQVLNMRVNTGCVCEDRRSRELRLRIAGYYRHRERDERRERTEAPPRCHSV